MPLFPIPPDPEPTEDDLAPFLAKVAPLSDAGKRRILRTRQKIARVEWVKATVAANPDAFHMPRPPKHYFDVYLKMPLWEEIRAKVLGCYRYQCVACNRITRIVHHRDYRPRVLKGEDLMPLVPLCPPHHDEVHRVTDWQGTETILAKLVSNWDALVSGMDATPFQIDIRGSHEE